MKGINNKLESKDKEIKSKSNYECKWDCEG